MAEEQDPMIAGHAAIRQLREQIEKLVEQWPITYRQESGQLIENAREPYISKRAVLALLSDAREPEMTSESRSALRFAGILSEIRDLLPNGAVLTYDELPRELTMLLRAAIPEPPTPERNADLLASLLTATAQKELEMERLSHQGTRGAIAAWKQVAKWAEGLIQQLPLSHEGRNSWLLNYGTSEESQQIRADDRIRNNRIVPEPTTPAREPGDWQPIETAPKDHKQVILLYGCEYGRHIWGRGYWFQGVPGDGEGWITSVFYTSPEGDMRGIFIPTHWQPLPAVPGHATPTED